VIDHALRERTRRRRNGTAMRSLGGGSNRYTGYINLSGAQAHKISVSGPEISDIGR
jgi:hypothetical protein